MLKKYNYFDGVNWLRVVKSDKLIHYLLNDVLHRLDGPAKIHYYENNICFEEFFINSLNIPKQKLIDIEIDINNVPFTKSDMMKFKLICE